MDPLLLVAEWWWIAPVAAGGVTAGAFTARRRSRKGGRWLAYDAARHDLRNAQQTATERRMAVKVARADYARIAAERSAQRATSEQVATARRMLRERERDAKAAAAEVRARQVRLNAARAAIPAASAPRPLERLHAEHDAVTTRWTRYETDPATAAYLRAARHATEMRRAVAIRTGAAEFAAYRDAVADLERAFEAAEHGVRVQAGEVPAAPAWQDAAQDVLGRSAEAIERAAGAAASLIDAWTNRRRPRR